VVPVQGGIPRRFGVQAAVDPRLFFTLCAEKKFSLNTFETSTGKPGNFEVNNRSS